MQSAGLAGVGAMVILNSVYYTGARVLSQLHACFAGSTGQQWCVHAVTIALCVSCAAEVYKRYWVFRL